MARSLILWSVVIVMVAVAIVDDILLRRSLDPRWADRDPAVAPGDTSGYEPDRARFFGSDGNDERILRSLRSLYPFRQRAASGPFLTPSHGSTDMID